MKTLSCTAPGFFQYIEGNVPELKKNHALIKIKRIGICGTDLHAFQGNQPYFEYPKVLGHELSAKLIAFDNAPGFEIDELVTIIPYFNCGHCIACRKGRINCCVNIKVCGVHIDGGMSEYLQVPSASLLHSQGLNPEELALVEPLAIGAHGVSKANINPGDYVLVIGAGPIGLGAMEFARIAGAKVIALDVNESRLKFCQDILKVDHTINAHQGNIADQLAHLTNGDMPDSVLDATGNLNAINTGFQYLSHTGSYILIGLQKGDICFSHPDFHKREAILMSSRNALRTDFDHVIKAIKDNLINPLNYITHRIDFEDVKNLFEKLTLPETGVIKAMIRVS